MNFHLNISKTEIFLHLLLPLLVTSTIKGLEQGCLAKYQFKVTGWSIMFICGMVLKIGMLAP